MTTTCARMAVIQDIGEELNQHRHGISISNDTVRLGLMPNASVIILCQHKFEGEFLEVHDDITIPRVESANQEKSLIWELLISTNRKRSRGKGANKLSKDQRFLRLAVVNRKSNSWRMKIHFEYLPPSN